MTPPDGNFPRLTTCSSKIKISQKWPKKRNFWKCSPVITKMRTDWSCGLPTWTRTIKKVSKLFWCSRRTSWLASSWSIPEKQHAWTRSWLITSQSSIKWYSLDGWALIKLLRWINYPKSSGRPTTPAEYIVRVHSLTSNSTNLTPNTPPPV